MVNYNSSSTESVLREDKDITQGKRLPQYVAATAVSMGAFGAGTVIGWTSNITEELQNGELNGIPVSEDALGWISSCANLGAMFMCIPIGMLCDKFGKKLTLLLFAVPFVAGWLFILFSNSLWMLYVGRLITGSAGGAFCVAGPLYTSEIAAKEIRGALGTGFQLFLGFGALFSNILAYIVPLKTETIILSTLPLLFAALFVFQPESPIYRMKQNEETKARAILVHLRGKRYDVDVELEEIKHSLEKERELKHIPLKESFKKRSTKKAAVVCFSLMFFQQLGGINVVVAYTSEIFKSAGVGLDEKLSSIILASISAIAIVISATVVDKIGRRILLINSGIFSTVGLLVLGVFFTLQERQLISEETLSTIGFLPLSGLSIFVVSFAMGYAPIPWIMAAELFPSEIRSVATGVVATFNWFLAFIIIKYYLNLKAGVGGDVTFYMFAGVAFLGSIFAFVYVPETKGKSLDQIQRELNEEKIK